MITKIHPITHSGLPGTTVFPLSETRRGSPQMILVNISANGNIPLHVHGTDATMIIVAGSATIIATNEDDGRSVNMGDEVDFKANEPHGFKVGPQGMSFLSRNGGIVDSDGAWDIEFR